MGGKMLQEVRQDLSDVVQVCQGKKKQTNYLRTLISDLVKGIGLIFYSTRNESGCKVTQKREKKRRTTVYGTRSGYTFFKHEIFFNTAICKKNQTQLKKRNEMRSMVFLVIPFHLAVFQASSLAAGVATPCPSP